MAATTLGSVSLQTPHRSFWRAGLEARNPGLPLHEVLVQQANLRGFMGAWSARPPSLPLEPEIGLEEIVVGLCCPQAPAEARLFKLVLRILQSGRVDPRRLLLLAKRERASVVLYWLISLVPDSERNPAFERIAEHFLQPPRGYRPLDYRYDAGRLRRRPLEVEARWPTQRS